MASFVVIYDACVLYPAQLRDLLLRVAHTGVVRARWTDDILDECFRALKRNRPDLDDSKLARTRSLICGAVDDSMVTGHRRLIDSVTGIPDQNDRHVVAAAIHAKAQVIVTSNLRHFPSEALEPWDIEAKHPDDFLADTIDLAPGLVVTAVTEMRDALKDPPKTIDELIDDFDRAGLVQTASRLRSIFTGAATWRGTDRG